MKTGAVFFLAIRTILGRKSDSRDLAKRSMRGAVISMAVSMVPLIVTLVVSDGMINGITSRYIELSTYHAQCIPYLAQDEEGISEALTAVRSVPGVRGAWAETESVGIAFAKGVRSGAMVRAVDAGFLEDPGTRKYLNVVSGEPFLSGQNDVLLGSEMARELGVAPGDVVSLLSVRSRNGGAIVPRVSVFKVRGVVSSGYRELDSRWFIVPRSSSSRYLDPQTSKTILGIKTKNPYASVSELTGNLKAALPEGWGVYPWPETEKNLYESFKTTRYLLLLIMGLTVAVAAVNISSALVTLVMERSREIAILKSLGASPSDIGRVFILGGVLLGFTGSTIGLACGTLAAVHINGLISLLERVLGILNSVFSILSSPFLPGGSGPEIAHTSVRILNPDYYLESIPVTLDFWALAGFLAAGLFLSYLASLLPARRASSLSPLEILRRH